MTWTGRAVAIRAVAIRAVAIRAVAIGAVVSVLGGCGVDALFLTELTRGAQIEVPGAGSNTLVGQASGIGAGAVVSFFSGTGAEITDFSATTGAEGAFEVIIPGSTELLNTLVVVAGTTQGALGIIPRFAKKATVWDDDRREAMGLGIEVMADLGLDSTFVSLVLLAKSRYGDPPVALAAIDPEALGDAAAELLTLLADQDERVLPLYEMLQRLWAAGATVAPPIVAFPGEGSYLDLGALAEGLDVDGDGAADLTTQAFDDALAAAVAALEFDVCFSKDTIRVVLMVDFNAGGTDRNCAPIDRWKWTKDEPGRQMFIVGSMHADTPNCDVDEPPCVPSDVIDTANQLLGNWVPNTTAMYDDGTHGDLTADDNIWTLSLELPWFDAGADDARWTRISYKYTWANAGMLWTTTEEWPGNSRILELRDVTGDRIITRYDRYGDETTNKDKANLLSPAKGGCGKVVWPSDGPKEGCANDVLENMIDTDGDCAEDTWPQPGSAAPITTPCPK